MFAGASGVYSQNNSNFFWDNTNNRLALGSGTATARLHLFGATLNDATSITESTSPTASIAPIRQFYRSNTTIQASQIVGQLLWSRLLTDSTTENTASISVGGTNVAGSSVGDMTINSKTSVALQTGGTSRLFVNTAGNVGVGTTSPSTLLHTTGTITSNVPTGNVSGLVLAVNDTAVGFLGSSASGTTLDSRGATFISFQTGSTERARINAGGDLLVGTTTAGAKIHATGGIASTGSGQPFGTNGTSAITMFYDTTNDVGSVSCLNNSVAWKALHIRSAGLVFKTSTDSEAARFDTSGNFLVGTTSAGAKIYGYTTASGVYAVRGEATNGVGVYGLSTGTGAAGNYGVYALSSGYYGSYGRSTSASFGGILGYDHTPSAYGIVGYIGYGLYTNASIYVNGTTYSSDARLKENVVPITGALAKLAQLNPVSFDWKANSNRGKIAGRKNVPDYGVIAQEVEPILPEVVFEAKSPPRIKEDTSETTIEEEIGTHKGVDYSRFIPFLIAAIKEQQSIIDTLKARLDAANI